MTQTVLLNLEALNIELFTSFAYAIYWVWICLEMDFLTKV